MSDPAQIQMRISNIEYVVATKYQGDAPLGLASELEYLEARLKTFRDTNPYTANALEHQAKIDAVVDKFVKPTEKKLTLFGENMTAFQTLSAVVKTHEQEANRKRNLLLAMLSVDWENLPVDTLVYANDNLDSLKNNGPRYFAGMVNNGSKTKFAVYSDGRTSVTARGQNHLDFCLPVNLMPL